MSTCSERLGHKHKQTHKQDQQTDGGMDEAREGDRKRKSGKVLNISHQ